MKHLRRVGAALLAAALLLTSALAAEGLERFQPVNTYTAGTFRDVPTASWYGESVGGGLRAGPHEGHRRGGV